MASVQHKVGTYSFWAVMWKAAGFAESYVYLAAVEYGVEWPTIVLQVLQGLPHQVEAFLTVQLGLSLQRSLRPLQGLHPQGLPPKGLPLQGLPPLVEGSLTMQSAPSLPTNLHPPPRQHPSRLPLLALHQASGPTVMLSCSESVCHRSWSA